MGTMLSLGTDRHQPIDPMNPSPTLVDVVIPTFNNLGELRASLAALAHQTHRELRAHVCVDGSTDGTLEYLATLADAGPGSMHVLTHPGNGHRGLAATRNLALDVLEGEYVWYVDSDMVPAPDALAWHLSLVQERSCVSQGQVVYMNAHEAPWAGYLDTRAYHRRSHGVEIPFTWFSAANALIRRADVQKLRGFDARFVGYGGEEFDFAYRLQCVSGQPIINNKRAVATTVEHKTIETALAQFQEYGATNLHLLESLHPEMPPTFELQRLGSRAIADRLFVALLNPGVERIADALIRIGPRPVRNRLLNYKVIAAVWRGYRSASAPT